MAELKRIAALRLAVESSTARGFAILAPTSMLLMGVK